MTALAFDVVGAKGPLRYFESLTRGRLAHAYLFTGPQGVGKKTFARRLAQSLLCLAPKPGVVGYDGTCAACVLFKGESAHHPDFLEHEGTLKIGDPDAPAAFGEGERLAARDIVRQLSMQSYSGGMRVLLLGDVAFATAEAANAMLKFLEEPPNGVLILLDDGRAGPSPSDDSLAHHRNQLPASFRSRGAPDPRGDGRSRKGKRGRGFAGRRKHDARAGRIGG